MLSLQEFEDLLDRWGDDFASWPDTERRAALALIEREPRAQALLDEAQKVRELLTAQPMPRARPELAARILAAAEVGPQPAPQQPTAGRDLSRIVGFVIWVPRFWLRPVLVLPLCFALGLLFGVHSVPDLATSLSSDEVPAFFLAMRP